MLNSFQILGCHMSFKVHYLQSYVEKFPSILADFGEEQGERFHHDIKIME